jgi:hypothetical protein
MEKNKNSKTWKYVINNYTEHDSEWAKRLDCVRHRCSKEIGKNGTPHLQGMITFSRAYRLTGLKKLHGKAHWEIAICSDFNYENKVDSEWLIDINNSKQGRRSDLELVAEQVAEKATLKEIALKYPVTFMRNFKGIDRLRSVLEEKTGMATLSRAFFQSVDMQGQSKSRMRSLLLSKK